jgi:AcrR family transcriptional regulator
LDAARQCLLSDGLRQTSLDDIAASAGVGRATLFRRFPNRRALLLALATREATAAINAVDQAVADIDDPMDFLEAGLIAVIHQITGNDLLQRLLVTDPDVVLPVASVEGSAILAMGREYIAGQLRRIEIGDGNLQGPQAVQAMAEMLARLVLSLALNPVSVLPLDDDLRLGAFVRQTVAPLLVRPTSR